MARSVTIAQAFTLPDQAHLPFTVFDSQADEYFEVSRQKGELVQSQFALDRNGTKLFRQSWKVSYVIGTGESGIGFLIHRDAYLFEAPLSYYTQSKLWGFSPGYESHNYGFTRPAVAECLGCHSGRPQPVYGTAGLYRNPPFAELGIGCENCHGPGELHVSERRAGRPLPMGIDTSIVNPARLSGWMSDNICMKCHQAGDVRVEQPGKHDQDFRPGTPLESVLEIFKAPPSPKPAGQSPVLLEHYYSMILSKCYRVSSGKLHCTTCHDPHMQPSVTEAPVYFRSRCLSCHNSRPCTRPAAERENTNPPDNCTGCHMPKRPVVTIAHAALTEHRIVVSPNESLSGETSLSVSDNSGLIRLTAEPGSPRTEVPDVALFQVYAKLIHDGHDELRPRMDELLDRLSRAHSQNIRVLSALARREVQKGTVQSFQTASAHLSLALKNGDTSGEDFLLLGNIDSQSNKHAEAIQVLQAGIQRNPYLPELREALAAEYVNAGDYRSSAEVIGQGLGLFPDDRVLRTLGSKVQSATVDGLTGSHSP